MLLRDKLSQRFQYGANCRSCGLKSLVQARLGLSHPCLVGRDSRCADAVFRDFNQHWTVAGFELNNLGHTIALRLGWMAPDVRSALLRARTTGATSTLARGGLRATTPP